MTKFVILFAIFVALGLPVFPSVSHAQVSPPLAQKAPDAAKMEDIANKKGYVRIIAEFSGPVPAGQLRAGAAQLGPVRRQIASMQDAIIASHFGSAASPRAGQGFQRGLVRFDISPMFAVNVTKTELESLAADPRVVHIHLDQLMSPVLLQSVPLIGMPSSYVAGATGAGQAVAIVDTGVQSNHEFLAGKVVMEACFSNSGGGGGAVTLCPNGTASQTGAGAADSTTAQCINGGSNLCAHGTHVAGDAAGKNTNPGGGKPDNGVARDANIVAVQVFTRFNDAPSCAPSAPPCVLAFTSDQISALNWIFANALTPAAGVQLASANMSLGGNVKNTTACDANPLKPSIDNLRGAGVATAIAAGNNGFVDGVSAPGCISTAVTVGSSDKQDVISSFSNMASMVKLMAPGGFGSNGGQPCTFGANNPDILSSVAGTAPAVTNSYACFAGTSMATPHVAGAFAAIRTACPTATVDQILTALQNTGKPVQDTRAGGTQTKPRIQVNLALAQICVLTADLAITKTAPGSAVAGSTFNYTINVTNQGPSNATGVVVTDPLPAGTSFTASSIPCSGAPLTCNIGNMANGASTSFTITAKVSASLLSSLGVSSTTITNTASVKGDQVDPNPANNTSSAGTLITESADLQLVKTCGPTPFALTGHPAFCDIQVSNLGVSDAQHVVVNDAIASGVKFTVTAVSGAACAPTTPIGPTTATALACNLGTLAAGSGQTVHVVFTTKVAGTINDTATVTSTTPDPNSGNNSATGKVNFHSSGLRP